MNKEEKKDLQDIIKSLEYSLRKNVNKDGKKTIVVLAITNLRKIVDNTTDCYEPI